jgi:FtsH-binding integral membrane protein
VLAAAGFTLFIGLLLGPLFQQILGLKNGALVMLAASGTAAVFFGLSAVASEHGARLQRPRPVPAGRRPS